MPAPLANQPNNSASAGPTEPRGRDEPTVYLEPAAPIPAVALTTHGSPAPSQTTRAYQILCEIGRGGMSVVSLARDTKLGRFVALKRLGAIWRAQPEMQERFQREARLIASLSHIHIVRLFDVGEDAEGPFLVMEYVPGPAKSVLPDRPPPSLNLEQKVEQNRGPLWPREAVSIVRKLCGAVDYAHRHGVIHRDLKPSNILLDEFGEPRVVDFGLACHATPADAALTATGTRLLSLGFGAPEQELDAGLATACSDVYSLGGVLYFCLTGENPRFFRDSRVVDYLRPAMLKALDRDPAQRWRTPADFAEALAESVADYLSPVSDVGMWRCKWCNALNPLSARHCHQCQWDGMEACPECKGETRVGVRFCASCGTDIKAFEDLRTLAQRLRDYRRQRDFSRLQESAEAAGQFQARGPRGRELLRRIHELGDTASWAQQRKEVIGQAITAAMQQEQYEVARERLNEYDLLAESDEFDDLRREIPWRLAERDIVAVCQEGNRARALLGEHRLHDARAAVEKAREGRLRLTRVEAQHPELQSLFTATGSSATSAFADELARSTADIDTITQALAAAETQLERLRAAASAALAAQDYERCLALCREARAITTGPSPMDVLERQASEAHHHVRRLLGDAEQALAAGRISQATHIGRLILKHHQITCGDAQALLDRIAHRQRKRRAAAAVVLALLLVLLYPLSMGPVYRAITDGRLPSVAAISRAESFYAPIRWLHARTPLHGPLDAYLNLWGAPPPEN